ncbi:MAG TPA: BBP7 family outer membrane beta-barrel protein [Pirellulaceae bacterium]|nr:BBP7 family outer membrane beta-barrel protein [Pirellulaceae bacterium]
MILRIHRVTIGSLLFASIAVAIADCAELRTSAASRPINRTVSFQEVSFQDAVEDPEMIDSVVESDLFHGSCDSCGVKGCAMDCLVSNCRWTSVDYLLWWRRGQDFPALVTTSPGGTAQGAAGVLPDATVLFGNETIGEEARPGGRVTIGSWLNDCQTCGVEGRFFALGNERISYTADSATFPILARPFRDPITQAQEATLLAFPGFTGPGNVGIISNSNVLGGDFLYRWQAAQSATTKMDLLVGYQFSRMDEDFNINSATTAINVPGVDAGTTFTINERFHARNEFHAVQIGLAATYKNCNWNVDLLAKLGFGNMRQIVNIGGHTTIVTPGPGTTTNTLPGPLAGAANSGRHVSDEFAVSPELGVNCRYSITPCLDLGFGYSFLYWSSIAQAGNQIDSMLNDPPGAFTLNSGSYWVHGLNVGANFRF